MGLAVTILVAVITPGPNNFLVMALSAERGFMAAIPAMGGVILGTLALLVAVLTGAEPLFRHWPAVQPVAATIGGGLLLWLAVGMMIPRESGRASPLLPRAGFWPLFAFQLVNPKSWTLVLMVVALSVTRNMAAIPILLFLFTVLPAFSLLLWALAGQMVTKVMNGPARSWVDRALGGVLGLTALWFMVANLVA